MRKNWIVYLAVSLAFCILLLPFNAEAFRGFTASRFPQRDFVPVDSFGQDSDSPAPEPQPDPAPAPQPDPELDPEPDPEPAPAPDPGSPDDEPEQDASSGYSRFNRLGGDRYNNAFMPSPSSPEPVTPPKDEENGDPPAPGEPEPEVPDAPSWLTSSEARAYELLNEFRIDNNLEPVQIDSRLVEQARLKAEDMIENNYFSHTSPTYGSVGQMLSNAGISYVVAGENLSKAGTVFQAHLQLKHSTMGHRQIMLNSRYDSVGIGIKPLQRTPGILMVQIFIESS